ncbi:MAG: hypothetical protein ACKV19_15360 [Verrucomicrobiales bacterium]
MPVQFRVDVVPYNLPIRTKGVHTSLIKQQEPILRWFAIGREGGRQRLENAVRVKGLAGKEIEVDGSAMSDLDG